MALERLTLPLPVGSGLAPLTILHLSDLHIRGERDRSLQRVLSLKAIDCDITCVTGDIADNSSAAGPAARALGSLAGRLGVFAVRGNHDLDLPIGRLEDELAANGVQLLENRALAINGPAGPFNLVGTGDPHRRRHDLDEAYAEASGELGVLLLTHSPDGVFDLANRRCDLALCGHTHGGQINPPLLAAPTNTRNRLPAAAGVMMLSGRLTHVSAGLGWSGVPLRWRCPAAAQLIRLVEVDA